MLPTKKGDTYCDKCKKHYLSDDAGSEPGPSTEADASEIEVLRRCYYGCRPLESLGSRIANALEPKTDTNDPRRKLLRALFDFSDSTILACECPTADAGILTLSYTYEEEMDPCGATTEIVIGFLASSGS